jgi:3-methyladenine DNA glycosylase AlkD
MALKKKAAKTKKAAEIIFNARGFIEKLSSFQKKADIEYVQRFFRDTDTGNKCMGVRFGNIFKTAKDFSAMPLKEVEKLLDSPYYEVRMGAVSIMDFQARNKKITPEHKKALYDLYIKRHDRINNWDLVDRSAVFVVGGYLIDKPRAILYKLAKSKNTWERRTAIVCTYFFIRQGDSKDTFNIAEILLNDEHDLIQKAVGSWIREAGQRDKPSLFDFLDRLAPKMPRTMLRYAVEKLDKKKKDHYLGLVS